MQPDPMVLAYLAGAMDADGHITVQRSARRKGNRYKHCPTYYYPRMGYTSIVATVPLLLKETFGGTISEYQSTKAAHHRLLYIWYIGTARCGIAARMLAPYIRQKKRQAELVAELCDVISAQHEEQLRTQKPPYRITLNQLAIRDSYWREVTALNQPRNRRVHFVESTAMAA